MKAVQKIIETLTPCGKKDKPLKFLPKSKPRYPISM